jgi:hypothetical protein
MALTLAEANRIAQGAVDKAREMPIKISVAQHPDAIYNRR